MDTAKNDYSNLEAGRVYTVMMRDGSENQKILFRNVEGDNIIGTAGKKDSTVVTIPKANVAAVRDSRKAKTVIGASIIGAAGVAALGISASRADN